MTSSLVPFALAVAGAIAMALAFPKTNWVALAPLGAVGLFWAWFGVSPRRAFWIGWVAGTVFFTIDFAWFGETAGAFIAPFGFFLTLGPAVGDAFFGFALVGVLVAFAASRAPRALAPLAGAAAFAFGEWLRSEGLGPLGVPFGSLAYSQVDSPLAPLAAFAGPYGLTFVLCTLAAYAAYAIRLRGVRPAYRDAFIAFACAIGAVALAWSFWPARNAAAPTYRVAAIQGNIQQKEKFTPDAFYEALQRYDDLTRQAAAERPKLIVWPETVIPVALNRVPWLQARFASLAKTSGAELVVGTLQQLDDGDYNVLYFFRSDGGLDAVYRKRQLVPFTEHLPFARVLSWIPWTKYISHYSSGETSGVVSVHGMRFGPVICWESAFSGLVVDDVRDGADALIVATDDAWFGTTAGPYQHAQISQMRAIETGSWVVRAAATGLSGIIAPTGRFVRHSELNQLTIVTGAIGAPATTVYAALGAAPVPFALALLYAGILAAAMRRRPAAPME
jgi:apolipoprotein N-acyltransferase